MRASKTGWRRRCSIAGPVSGKAGIATRPSGADDRSSASITVCGPPSIVPKDGHPRLEEDRVALPQPRLAQRRLDLAAADPHRAAAARAPGSGRCGSACGRRAGESRTGRGSRRSSFFIAGATRSGAVQRLDLGFVLLVDRLALQLHRRRQLVAARAPTPRAGRLNFLICSTRDIFALASSTPSWTAAISLLLARPAPRPSSPSRPFCFAQVGA